MEWAFASPLELERRLGKPLDAKRIAQMDPEALAAAFSSRPALHRYPGSMAARVQEMAKLVVERYHGKTEELWAGATSGADLIARVKELPGFGEQKAKIFVALLGKQLGVRPVGWESVSAPFSDPGSFRSVADITDVDSLNKVRSFKQALKAANKAKGSTEKVAQPTKKTGPSGAKAKTAAKGSAGKTTTKSTAPGRAPASAGKR